MVPAKAGTQLAPACWQDRSKPASGRPGAVSPLDSTQEGRFIWVKTESGVFYLVRIVSVEAATYEDLLAGQMVQVVLAWRGPVAGE